VLKQSENNEAAKKNLIEKRVTHEMEKYFIKIMVSE